MILSAISDMDAKQEAGQISDHLARINQEIVVINHQAEKLVYKLERYLKSSKNKNFTGLNYIDSFNGKLRCNNFNPWHFMGVISRKMGYESEQELANFEVLSAIVSEVLSSLSKDNQWVIDLINQNKLQGIFQALIDELQAIQEFIAFGQSRLLILANSVVLAYEGINYAIKK
ncbi:MAG: hypothetical protein HWD59_05730 [Coxiellaceae bacterium]|nr:MAG: hypothetical protein HWD59_05730 [Coxiellaceae bacterium]